MHGIKPWRFSGIHAHKNVTVRADLKWKIYGRLLSYSCNQYFQHVGVLTAMADKLQFHSSRQVGITISFKILIVYAELHVTYKTELK